VLTPNGAGQLDIRVCSTRPDAPTRAWTTHASAKVDISTRPSGKQPDHDALGVIQRRCGSAVAREDLYRTLRDFGIEYGPTFQTIDAGIDGVRGGRRTRPIACHRDRERL